VVVEVAIKTLVMGEQAVQAALVLSSSKSQTRIAQSFHPEWTFGTNSPDFTTTVRTHNLGKWF
jgi:hypothetical protein